MNIEWVEIDIDGLSEGLIQTLPNALERYPALRGYSYTTHDGHTCTVTGVCALFPSTHVWVESTNGKKWSCEAWRLDSQCREEATS